MPRLLLAALVGSLSACGSTVTIEGSPPPAPSTDPAAPCVPEQAQEHELRVDGPGSLIAGRLHLTGSLDGEDRYLVGELREDELWLSEPPEIDGPAVWVEAAEGHARLTSLDDGLELATLDVTDPDAPQITARLAVDAPFRPGAETFTAVDGALRFCTASEDGAAASMAVGIPSGELEAIPPLSSCSSIYDHVQAQGPLFIGWTEGDNASLSLTDAEEGSSLVSFGFAIDGIHAYGELQGAATDGERAVFSPANDDWMLLFDDAGTHGADGPYVSFAPSGPKRLLAVVDRIAYFAVPEGMRAYDVDDVSAPSLLEDQATGSWDPTALTFVTATPDEILVHDDDGQLWRAPRRTTAPITPVVTYVLSTPSWGMNTPRWSSACPS